MCYHMHKFNQMEFNYQNIFVPWEAIFLNHDYKMIKLWEITYFGLFEIFLQFNK